MKTTPPQKPETVTVGGITAKISRSDSGGYESWIARYYVDGVRKALRATTLEDAKARAKDALRDVSSGAAHVKGKAFSPKETAAIEAALSKLTPTGVPLVEAVSTFAEAHRALAGAGTIAEAVQYFLADKERRALRPITVPELVAQFLAEKKAEKMSDLYMTDITRRLTKFAKAFSCEVATITTAEIADWLKSIKATGRNGNNYRNAVCTLLSHARERGHLIRDKKTEAELLKRFKEGSEEIGIYTPNEIRRLLGAADGKMRTCIAIGAFAGLRNMEIFRLDWQDINLEAGRIIVSADKAKTAQRRVVPILPNLKSWLELTEPDERKGRVSPTLKNLTNFSRAISTSCKAAGLEMVGNGLRHSFASYRLASVQSADQVALEMGNSPRKLFQHYRELVTETAAEKWFNVTIDTPIHGEADTPANVISIRKGQAA